MWQLLKSLAIWKLEKILTKRDKKEQDDVIKADLKLIEKVNMWNVIINVIELH